MCMSCRYLVVCLALSAALHACRKEEIPKTGEQETVRVSVVPEVVGERMKSAFPAAEPSDPAVFDGFYLYAFSDGRLEQCYESASFSPHIPELVLVKGKKYNIYALANIPGGEQPLEIISEKNLLEYSIDSKSSCYLAMAGVSEDFCANGKTSLTIGMRRVYSRITFRFESHVDGCRVRDVRLGGSAASMNPFKKESRCFTPGKNDHLSESDYEKLAAGGPVSMYALENCHGRLLPDNDDPLKKEPSAIGEMASCCTWIEADIDMSGSSLMNGTLVYRTYLGEDDCQDFSLRRNTEYNVTLELFPAPDASSHIESCWKFDRDDLSDIYQVRWTRHGGRIGPGQYDEIKVFDGYGHCVKGEVDQISIYGRILTSSNAETIKVEYMESGTVMLKIKLKSGMQATMNVECFKPDFILEKSALNLAPRGTPDTVSYYFVDTREQELYFPDYDTKYLAPFFSGGGANIGWSADTENMKFTFWVKRLYEEKGTHNVNMSVSVPEANGQRQLAVTVNDVFSGISPGFIGLGDGESLKVDTWSSGVGTDISYFMQSARKSEFARNEVEISDFHCTDSALENYTFKCTPDWKDIHAALHIPYYENECAVPCGVCSFRYAFRNIHSGETCKSSAMTCIITQKVRTNLYVNIRDHTLYPSWDCLAPRRASEGRLHECQLAFADESIYCGKVKLPAKLSDLGYKGTGTIEDIDKWMNSGALSANGGNFGLKYSKTVYPITIRRKTVHSMVANQNVPYFIFEEGRYLGCR